MQEIFITLAISFILPFFAWSKMTHIISNIITPILIIIQLCLFLYNETSSQINIQYIIPLSFSTNDISIYFTCFICFLWAISSVYSIFYIEHKYGEKKISTFMFFYNISVVNTILIAFSSNLITTFIFYEMLTVSTIPLVCFCSKSNIKKSVMKYVFLLSFTAFILFLPAIFLFQNIIGTTDFMPNGLFSTLFMQNTTNSQYYNVIYTPSNKIMLIILVMLLFGVAKNAIFPFNGWLPAAMCAPAPVSALLHAVAVVKSGAFVTYKIIYELYGIEYFSHLKELYKPFFVCIAIVVVIGIIISSIMAIRSNDLKKILAYSTISNMTYIFMLFFTGTENGMTSAFWQIAIHSMTKINLFFIAGVLYLIYHTNNYKHMIGIFNNQKLLTFSTIISCFTLMGLPFTAGYIVKHFTIETLTDLQENIMLFGIVFSSLMTVYYLGKPLAYFNTKKKSIIIEQNIQHIIYYIIFPLSFLNFVGFVVYLFVK